MAEITIKMSEDAAKGLLARADAIKVFARTLITDTSEGQILEDICNQIRQQIKETSTIESIGMSKQEIKKVIFNYLCDYAEYDASLAEDVSVDCYPNWGELDSYQHQYPQLMNALMEGGDEEFENIIKSVIETWSK
jgi:hypothetical protein